MKSPSSPSGRGISRRSFVKKACVSLAGLAASRSLLAALEGSGGISLVVDPEDAVAASRPSQWALGEFKAALGERGATVRMVAHVEAAPAADFCVVIAGADSHPARRILESLGLAVPPASESLCLAQADVSGRRVLLAAGRDPLGLVYAVTEMTDRVRCLEASRAALEFAEPVIEQPASRVRSVVRQFCSEVEDKEWFYDREFWRRYLDTLVSSRVNRFSFATGMGYNSAIDVTDGYFLMTYAFLVDVPGYSVRIRGLSDEERARNLATLKFIGDETVRRGMQFQLGIWTQAYRWVRSPNATYVVEGLTDSTHGPYCRDGLAAVLREIPAISGLTFRVHSESGIPAGEFDFWKTLFSAIAQCGRRVEIDMHAKNAPQETLDIAVATGMPVVLSPKYCGEHLCLPYHPASIREYEMAPPGSFQDTGEGLSRGNRIFSRYGYADLFAENRRYDVLFRIWPGTRRFMLTGDPAGAAGHGRSASFCGALGVELCEPLAFKGRMGSGLAGGRCGYADSSLVPRYDFEKYLYTYRVWGRLTYNPDAAPETWRRYLRQKFGKAAGGVEEALAPASRVLPLVTLAHAPSADCTLYWPEMYTNMPISDPARTQPYTDNTPPKLFGNMGSFDPQLFLSPDACADALVEGRPEGKYSPLEVAQWLEDIATACETNIAAARAGIGGRRSDPEFRRLEEDVGIQRGLALFFAGKFRSAVLWRIHSRTGSRDALEASVRAFSRARSAWAEMAKRAESVYRRDISYGNKTLRGHWADRLPAIDGDLADLRLRQKMGGAAKGADTEAAARALRMALGSVRRPEFSGRHSPAPAFRRGEPHLVELATASPVSGVVLHYRHVNQAERWQRTEMARGGQGFQASMPAAYTGNRYPLQYYFEAAIEGSGRALFPALKPDLSNVPYYVVRGAA